jgi:hypothetical protein
MGRKAARTRQDEWTEIKEQIAPTDPGTATLSIVLPLDQHQIIIDAVRMVRRGEETSIASALAIICKAYLEANA